MPEMRRKLHPRPNSGRFLCLGRRFFAFDVGDPALLFDDFVCLLAHMSLLSLKECVL
jgi:hypothetical protein